MAQANGEITLPQSAAAGKVRGFVWLFHMALPVLALWLLLARPRLDLRWEHHQGLQGIESTIEAYRLDELSGSTT